jgi:hypothetical protein
MLQGKRNNTYHLDFGTYYHAGSEAIDKHLALHPGDLAEAILVGVREALVSSAGFESPDNRKTRRTLIRSLIWKVDEYGNTLPTYVFKNGTIGSELSFAIPAGIKSETGEDFLLCGHMDGIVEFMGDVAVKENKTSVSDVTKPYYTSNFTPDIQISMYHLAANVLFGDEVKVNGVLVEACQVGVGFSRFNRFIAKRHEENIPEVLLDFQTKIKEMEGYAIRNYWPKNEEACDKYGGCPFRKICSVPKSSREALLEGFEERFWDPLMVRE